MDMIADYFTKPLQGNQFKRFRNVVLGIQEVDIPRYNRQAMKAMNEKKANRAAAATAADDLIIPAKYG